MKRILSFVSFLQLSSLIIFIVLFINIILLYKHYSLDFFVDDVDFFKSIKIAFPPLVVLISPYLLALLFGQNIQNAPGNILSYIRNVFFQNRMLMIFFIIIGISSILFIYKKINSQASPQYETIVAQLLGGESDEYKPYFSSIETIQTLNNLYSNNLKIVGEVFNERTKRNNQLKEKTPTLPRIYIRTLETNISNNAWLHHPLRKFALAEAYSMLTEAIYVSNQNNTLDYLDNDEWGKYYLKSKNLYLEVYNENSNMTTELLKFSCLNNIANLHLYTNQLDSAVFYYYKTNEQNKNLATSGNLIALLVMLKKPQEAIVLSKEIQKWAENNGKALNEHSNYTSILVNTASAYLVLEQFKKASLEFKKALDMEPADDIYLNLALSLIFQKRNQLADYYLDKIKNQPLTITNQKDIVIKEPYSKSQYLIKGLLTNEVPMQAAYFLAYLGIPKSSEYFINITRKELNRIKELVKKEISRDNTTCRDFLYIPSFIKLFNAPKY